MSGVRIIDPAIIFGPFFVPGAYPIGHWIVTSGFLADPEDSRYDLAFPRDALSRIVRISCQLAWRKPKRPKIGKTILRRSLRFLVELSFCGFRLRICPVSEKGRD